MKELLAVGALVVFISLVWRWLGPPVRRAAGERRPPAPNPETDVMPPDVPVYYGDGGPGG
jgi:hypothetical protein